MSTFLGEYMEGGPNCTREDCTLQHNGPSETTLTFRQPAVDEHGRSVNPDANIITQPMRCLSCGKSWVEKWKNGIRIGIR